MKKYILASFLLHLAPLLVLLWLSPISGATGDSERDGGNNGTGGPKIVDKASEGKPRPPIEVEVTIFKPEHKSKGFHDCKGANWYGGIGIVQGITGDIIQVGRGYPAERAGLLVGDRLLTKDNIKGPPGTVAHLVLIRNGQRLTFDITREKICTEEEPPRSI